MVHKPLEVAIFSTTSKYGPHVVFFNAYEVRKPTDPKKVRKIMEKAFSLAHPDRTIKSISIR